MATAVSGGDDHEGALRVVGDLAADRSKQQSVEPAGAPRADDEHVGVPARGDENRRGEAADRLDRDRLRARSIEQGQRLVDFLACLLTSLVNQGVVGGVGDRAAREADGGEPGEQAPGSAPRR
jgi:hypothetical protein